MRGDERVLIGEGDGYGEGRGGGRSLPQGTSIYVIKMTSQPILYGNAAAGEMAR